MVSALPPLISSLLLADQLRAGGPSAPVIVHVGTTMAGSDPHAAYLDRRLPSARFTSLDDDLADPPAPVIGRHPLPSAAAFAAVLGRLGITPETTVVAYDDNNGAFAARLVWMLRITGQPAALLDGGLDAWSSPFESGPVEPYKPVFDRPAVPWPVEAIANADDVAAHIKYGGVVIDSRDSQRYAGNVEPIDAVAGHIPGALNMPFTDNLADGQWLSAPQLAERFAHLDRDPQAIVYCGSGVTACHNALAIESAGLPLPRVFVGSWSGWSSDRRRPVASDAR
ncbi:MAG: sulfurtransferase [Ilumatobacter sp.]|nr:sulfurtransferase [Ilumatobacter sp.]MDG1695392.1 sulfurtransferase [Ilumatobacter sp.]